MTAVIFDLDGTLLRLDVDIEDVRIRLGALFAPHGVTRPFRPILRRIRDAAREAAAAGADGPALERAGLELLSDAEVRAAASARARASAPVAVAALAARGFALGLVTDNGRACVEPALRQAGFDPAWFRATITRDEVAEPKPDPAGIVAAARALGATGARVFFVGDHPRDVEAARAARAEVPDLQVVALRGGYAGDDQLRAAVPDHLVESLHELSRILE
jgi:N-acetyl-D-muramate 6-phosphate phosphatase